MLFKNESCIDKMINYVINLDRRTDKWEEFVEKVDNSVELQKDKFIRISAFDGYNHDEELKRYNLNDNVLIKYLRQNKIKVRKGVFGCFISHLLALYNILQNDEIKEEDYVGIFEDDIMYESDFDLRYKNFKSINLKELDVEFIYIAGRFQPNFNTINLDMLESTKNKNIYFRKDKKEGGFEWDRCLNAYIVNKKICKKLIKLLTVNFVDTVFRPEAVDHLYVSFYKEIKMFDYFPHLIYSELHYKTDIQDNHDVIEF